VTKGPDAFRTISEAAAEVGVAQHVLRFWESKFSFIRPMKRAGGRRFYRPQDLVILRGVRRLLHEEGYTIVGVQRLHRERGVARLLEAGGGNGAAKAAEAAVVGAVPSGDIRQTLASALQLLETAKARLDQALGS
jgi:DNA-binding transcriptional MerR regulator